MALSSVLAAESTTRNPILPSANELVWGTVAFIIFFLFFAKYALPRLRSALAERTAAIEGKMEQAERDRAESARLLEEYRRLIGDARNESARIIEDSRRQAEAIRAEQAEVAREEAARIVSAAQAAVQAERQQAVAALRREVGGIALELASKIVGTSLEDDARQRSLVDDFIRDLESQEAEPSGSASPAPAGS